MTAESKIRVIFYPEGNVWIAQALECDLATSATSIREAGRRMRAIIAANKARTANLDAAPGKFFIMFEKGEELTPELMRELDDADLDSVPHIDARRRAQEARAS